MGAMDERLNRQLGFLIEIDKLKQVMRQSPLVDGSRKENDAEHSWHLAVMAMVLAEHADEPVDICRVMMMLVIHDIVEIDAGDTFAYDDHGRKDQEERERQAADRLFALLPDDQAGDFRALWDEFEEDNTADARFARALDRLQPMTLNYLNKGGTWRQNGVTADKVLARNRPIEDGSAHLWRHAKGWIDDALEKGYLKP
jgi:putative hydrolase of HD superfamily